MAPRSEALHQADQQDVPKECLHSPKTGSFIGKKGPINTLEQGRQSWGNIST